jgi:hypothetical protein
VPDYLTGCVLQFSEDPVSDATPTWVDVTEDMRSIEWFAGVGRDGEDPQAGGRTIRYPTASSDKRVLTLSEKGHDE